MKTRLLLLSSAFMACAAASAAPPQVTSVTASQQAGTKLVNIVYTLAVEGNQTTFVEIWFSPDNGLTYPVACRAVSGDVNASVSAGNKNVVWNAGEDWDHQFTQNGKIRVIATYGDQPSGFSGTGQNGGDGGHGGGQADASLITVPWDLFWEWDTAGGGAGGTWINATDANTFGLNGPGDAWFTKIKADPTEITNEKWDEVTDWALQNGYPGLPMAPANAVADEPRTGITFWEALKWCNARSEKDGLEPAYYLDASEARGDLNGDGNITAGTDTFELHAPGAIQDTNGNGKWDPGEPFTDHAPVTGVYQPQEYVDVNGNGQYDPGLTQVFRAGANIPDFGTWISNPASGPAGGIVSASPIKYSADGYRLPIGSVVMKLATGGNHQKKWPWGDEEPFGASAFPQFADYVLVGQGGAAGPTKPTAGTNRQPNQYGLKDLIGNVAEWSEDVWDSATPPHTPVAVVYGGSYLGLSVADTAVPPAFSGTANPANLFQLTLQGPLGASSPAIGFRCVSYE